MISYSLPIPEIKEQLKGLKPIQVATIVYNAPLDIFKELYKLVKPKYYVKLFNKSIPDIYEKIRIISNFQILLELAPKAIQDINIAKMCHEIGLYPNVNSFVINDHTDLEAFKFMIKICLDKLDIEVEPYKSIVDEHEPQRRLDNKLRDAILKEKPYDHLIRQGANTDIITTNLLTKNNIHELIKYVNLNPLRVNHMNDKSLYPEIFKYVEDVEKFGYTYQTPAVMTSLENVKILQDRGFEFTDGSLIILAIKKDKYEIAEHLLTSGIDTSDVFTFIELPDFYSDEQKKWIEDNIGVGRMTKPVRI